MYWVYFSKNGQPERIYADGLAELLMALTKLITEKGEMPEWIIRSYK